MRLVIGLTGNIGTGKSTVLRMLGELGAQTIDADKLAHEVMAAGGPAHASVVMAFGPTILSPDGEINRAQLGEIVFADAEAMARLETLVHPAVIERTQEILSDSEADVVAVEAIKLLESGMARQLCDAVWVVTCTPEQQLQRIMAQRGLSREDALLRVSAQPAEADKVAQADVVIDNSGTLPETREQVEAAWRALVANAVERAGTDGMMIRPATLADAAGVLNVLNTVVREKRYTALDRELSLDEERAFLRARGRRQAIFVAEHAGQIVGFLAVDPFLPDMEAMAHVASVGTYVLPEWRGRQIGSQLFAQACEFARDNGYEKVIVYVRAGNQGAQRFYQRMGFRRSGLLRRQVIMDGDYEDEVLSEYFLSEQEGRMTVLRRFWDEHPRLSMWAVLAVGMVVIMVVAARNVGFTALQWLWLVLVTIGLAGICAWIIGMDADEE